MIQSERSPLGRYVKVVERLAMNYGVANEKLSRLYSSAAYDISEIWDECGGFNSITDESEAINTQIESIFREVEERRLTEKSTLYFVRDVDEEIQANRQYKLYIGMSGLEHLHINLKKRSVSHLDIADYGVSIKIKLKPATKQNINNNPVGIQSIGIPHVDETKLDILDGFHLIYGNCQCIYKFDSGKEIKINVSTRKEALRVVNFLLKVVRPEVIKGTAAKNCKFIESQKSHHLEGVRADLVNIAVRFLGDGDSIVPSYSSRDYVDLLGSDEEEESLHGFS